MSESVQQVQEEAKIKLEAVKNLEDLEIFRLAFLSKKGKLTSLFQKMTEISADQRRAYGSEVNQLKVFLEQTYEQKKNQLQDSLKEVADFFDDSLPSIHPRIGSIHPISQTIREITKIFERLGF